MLLILALLQDPAVNPREVDAAIDKGIVALRARIGTGDEANSGHELILWTFVHAGMRDDDPDFQGLMKRILEQELKYTYRVSLRAMVLEQVDRAAYQDRLYQCAQFLVDNQCKNGQWTYGRTTTYKEVPKPKVKVATGGEGKTEVIPPIHRPKPKVPQKIKVEKQVEGFAEGDNSNSQYALLGLRACHDAGMELPSDVIKKAEEWWRSSQKKAKGNPSFGGWNYDVPRAAAAPWGSMTAGGVGSLVICEYLAGGSWKGDSDIKAGLAWLTENFTVTDNPGMPEDLRRGLGQKMTFYYLYALERACMLYDPKMAKLGDHDWYQEGARHLLKVQTADGSWFTEGGDATWDTCFAILFLRKATRPLRVATGGSEK